MKDLLKDFENEYPYPLTIVADRYSGTYSGGAFTAWNLQAEDVPQDINASDVECASFWDTADGRYYIGRGKTPDEAIKDLAERLLEKEKR